MSREIVLAFVQSVQVYFQHYILFPSEVQELVISNSRSVPITMCIVVYLMKLFIMNQRYSYEYLWFGVTTMLSLTFFSRWWHHFTCPAWTTWQLPAVEQDCQTFSKYLKVPSGFRRRIIFQRSSALKLRAQFQPNMGLMIFRVLQCSIYYKLTSFHKQE